MKLLVLTCFLASCLAQKPHPCESPSLLTGALTVSTQKEEMFTYAKYLYDALGQRVRLMELGTFQNKTFTYDALLLYKTAEMYEIYKHNRTCIKRPLKIKFQPLGIREDASLVSQIVLGSSSEQAQGLLVNVWTGNLPNNTGKYVTTVTEVGCVPVTLLVQTDRFGWVTTSFFDNVIGITDPNQLNPPDFCSGVEMKSSEEELRDLLSLFLKKN